MQGEIESQISEEKPFINDVESQRPVLCVYVLILLI